jgi:CBS-domain-containing membrane protein
MPKLQRAFDERFKPHWVSYVLQSTFAAFAVFVALATLRHQNLVVAASLAATAFTVFAMPSSITASSRNVIGGHMIGLAFGSAFALLPHRFGLGQDALYALAVGCAMLTMAATNTEHPPAAGTALGVVIAGFSARVVLGVIVGAAILSIIHRVLRPVLRDLVAAPEEGESALPPGAV